MKKTRARATKNTSARSKVSIIAERTRLLRIRQRSIDKGVKQRTKRKAAR